MKLTKYNNYKNTNIHWLGDIPQHWEVKRIKDIVRKISSGGTPYTENLAYWNGNIPWVSSKDMKFDKITTSIDFITELAIKDSSTTFITDKRILMVARSGILKHTLPIAINVVPVAINQDIKAIQPAKNILVEYSFWLFKGFSNDILRKCSKVGATVESIEMQEFVNFSMSLPPLSEQTAIANYLDQKTAQIDKKVELLYQKIEKYKELKKSLINQTVCRGLGKNIKLKPSGIDWIGDIPEHWEVKRLKDVSKIINGYAFNSNEYIETGLPIIRIGDIADNINILNTKKVEYLYLIRAKESKVKKGDILMAMTGATIGKSSIYNSEEMIFLNQRVCSIRTNKQNSSNYLKFVIVSKIFQDYVYLICGGSAQENISKSQLENFPIQISPNQTEQTAIAQYLDEKTNKIDQITSNLSQQIEALKELRKTLINEIVTGKVSVID